MKLGYAVRLLTAVWLSVGLLTLCCAPWPVSAATLETSDIAASPVTDVAVTVYRSAGRPDTLDLDDLDGFAFVTETRTVTIPEGESRIRFEGVADGIDPASAIVTGLPDGLIEKNHDAHVLSPSALVAATVGHEVTWIRANPKTGQAAAVSGTLLSDADGVVFRAATRRNRGTTLLRIARDICLRTHRPRPTRRRPLSALVHASKPVQAQVRLSYLAGGFDWMAHYSAIVAPDAKTMTLGAWVTLANNNSVSFTERRSQGGCGPGQS